MKEPSIADILSRFRKVELEDLGSILGQDFPSSLRKPELVRNLAGYLTDHPKKWLSHLLERDIRLLRELVRSGPERIRYMDDSEYPSILELSGLLDHDESDGRRRKVWVRREVYEIVAPHIDQVIRSGERSGRFEIERMGLGFLNLYGILTTGQFLDLMMDYHDIAFGTGYDSLVRVLKKSTLVKVCRYSDAGEDYICSPCLPDTGEILRLRKEAGLDTEDLQLFPLEDVLEAGSGAPCFMTGFKTPQGVALTKILRRIGYAGFDLVKVQHDIWLEAQLPFRSDTLFDALTAHEDSISSDSLYRACLNAIVDYANVVPKWALNGYSAKEKDFLFLEYPEWKESVAEEPAGEGVPQWTMPRPTISEGYTDLIEKDDALDRLSSLMPEGLPFGLAIPHVAPGDPCPCGSGLRYAHCHGKNPN